MLIFHCLLLHAANDVTVAYRVYFYLLLSTEVCVFINCYRETYI